MTDLPLDPRSALSEATSSLAHSVADREAAQDPALLSETPLRRFDRPPERELSTAVLGMPAASTVLLEPALLLAIAHSDAAREHAAEHEPLSLRWK